MCCNIVAAMGQYKDPVKFFDEADKFYNELVQRHIKHQMNDTSSEPTQQLEEQAKLLKCPKCKAPMRYKTYERNGQRGAFYGCTKWGSTGCKGSYQVEEAEELLNPDDKSDNIPF